MNSSMAAREAGIAPLFCSWSDSFVIIGIVGSW